jgi:DNA mismatch repair protein MutS
MSVKKTLFDEYWYYQSKFEDTFGKYKTIVFMQVGSFFEAYQFDKYGYDVKELSKCMNIVVGRNKKSTEPSKSNPYRIGFNYVSKDKFMKILIDAGYTVIIVEQLENGIKEPKREVTGIYTASTYIDTTTMNHDFINTICLYVAGEKQHNGSILICIGISVIDVTTGYSAIHEAYSSHYDHNNALDEASRFINCNNYKEIIIYNDNSTICKHKLLSYLEIESANYRYYETINKKHIQIHSQEDILKKVYIRDIPYIMEYLELDKFDYARIAYVILIEYIYQINERIINEIKPPIIFKNKSDLIIGNNAFAQLNVYSANSKDVLSIIDKTVTAMGYRMLKYNLLHPITDCDELNNRYEMVKMFMMNNIYKTVHEHMIGIVDIERYYRKQMIGTLQPYELFNLVNSSKQILKLFKKSCLIPSKKSTLKFDAYIAEICDLFNLEELQKYSINNIYGNIFNEHTCSDLNDMYTIINNNNDFLNDACNIFSKYIGQSDAVSLKKTNRGKYYFVLTKRRSDILIKNISDLKHITINDYRLNVKNINISAYGCESKTNSHIKISFDKLNTISSENEELYEQIINRSKKYYVEYIKQIYNKYKITIHKITNILAKIDVYCSIAKVATSYKYTCPIIVDHFKSFVRCDKLRHPIIERLDIGVEYIPHDIDLSINSMLLYGLNNSGKSSLMKSLGISIIMAQSGLFVPANSFEYYPYDHLFTRIIGTDNILKGLSSFTLEMMEIKSILKRSTHNTLVIGDEICRSTDNVSGNAIVSSTILKLSSIKASYIFATHLHELYELSAIKKIKNLSIFHLDASYEDDNIIFNRNLKPGAGDKHYGITVAKYIVNDDDFIEQALNIKKELLNTINSKSKYNPKLSVDKCSICSSDSDIHTHHINYVCNSINGFVGNKSISLNDLSNLISVCSKCHKLIHTNKININGYIDTSKGKLLNIS